MKRSLPDNVRKYSETPVFTETTVPEKLTNLHTTKAGTWGRLCVLEGQLKYIIPGPSPHSVLLKNGEFDIISPEEPHHVEITGPVRFKVEFYK